ncbi:hypothetical protein [Kozakia baliensis]|uniref:Uncharacterized protein n=1 Tax=Kozakia baliensis TaxID=153496 RepID=A0A1D8UT27_9PROT|nr:hypothetical protein [Kozakia baliensis]AOX16793.1 hypothetical protein A0U89_06230 [Kozakia baliensis]GBR32089.1 hypothetical protein AA0488_2459 [Kozakia baliensis NRIC 0488]GEL64650.1 hypothetical protein KBA01_19360 [Kozakia baliensis]
MTSPITPRNTQLPHSELSAALEEYRRKAEQAGIRPGDPLHAWVEATDRLFEALAARFEENESRQDETLQRLQEAVYRITQISVLLTKTSPTHPPPPTTLEGHVVRDQHGMLAVFFELAADVLPFLRRPGYRLLLVGGVIFSSFLGGVVMEQDTMSRQMTEIKSTTSVQADHEREEAQNKVEQVEKHAAEVITAAHEHDAAVAEFRSAMRQAPPSIVAWAAVIKSNPFTEIMRDQCRETIHMSQQPPYRRSCSIEITLGSQDAVNAIAGN